MSIKVGDRLPDHEFMIMTVDGPAKLSTSDLFAGKKVILVAVPGAFTPTCHGSHLPGFLENLDAIKEKGVDAVAVVSVNDVHVIAAWAEASRAGDRITFLSDGNADFARQIGMDVDLGVAGMGVRSKRYSMLVEDGVVTSLNVEDSPGQAVTSSAATILEQL